MSAASPHPVGSAASPQPVGSAASPQPMGSAASPQPVASAASPQPLGSAASISISVSPGVKAQVRRRSQVTPVYVQVQVAPPLSPRLMKSAPQLQVVAPMGAAVQPTPSLLPGGLGPAVQPTPSFVPAAQTTHSLVPPPSPRSTSVRTLSRPSLQGSPSPQSWGSASPDVTCATAQQATPEGTPVKIVQPARLCTGSPTILRGAAPPSVAKYPTLLGGSIRFVPTVQVVAKEDSMNQHLQSFLSVNPHVQRRHNFFRRPEGTFQLDGERVQLEWQAPQDGNPGELMVVEGSDGSMRTSLLDYIQHVEALATTSNPLSREKAPFPRDKLISFNDGHEAYSRLDAMKVAKEQALVREKVAGYLQAGKALPDDLMDKYRKSLRKKLAPVSIRKLREQGTQHQLHDVGT